MTLRPQFGLSKAGGDDGAAAAHPAQGGGGRQTEFPSLRGNQIGNFMRLEMPPHILDGIQFGRIRWQPLDLNPSTGGGDVVLDQETAMNGRTIPEDQQFPGNMALKMFQEFNHLKAFDAAGVDLKIKPPQGQTTDQRKTFPIEGFVEHRGLPARSPGAGARGASAQAAFVDEDDGPPLLPGLFFKAGHVTRCQRRMAFSSRSTARRSGRWQLKPLAPSKRQT